MRFDLAAMGAAMGRRGTALLPTIAPSLSFERSYLIQLRKIERQAIVGFGDLILPSYQRTAITIDADETSWSAFRLFLEGITRAVTTQVRELIGLEARRHTRGFMAAARSAFGIDLTGVVSEGELGPALEVIGLRNAGLIKGFTDDMIKWIQQETLSAVLNGEGAKSLAKRIQSQMGVSDARARLIARDQTGKLNGSLNKIRHQQAGIAEYIWRTSHDERVRKRHRAIDGKRYKYGEPTGAENGAEPGQPIQCRCIAQAVVEFGGKEFQTQEAIRAPELPPEQAAALAKAMKKRPWTAPIERGAAPSGSKTSPSRVRKPPAAKSPG